MFVTLTLNPSLDRTFDIERFVRGDVNRVEHSTAEAAGKGVNVARALDANGFETIAVLPLGGSTGIEMTRLLEADGPPFETVRITEPTRANVTVVESDGTVTKLNEPGAALSADDLERLIGLAMAQVRPGGWLVASGSLPPGVGTDIYARIVIEARAAGARVAIDASGPALAKAITAGPDLVKPNLPELCELTGREITTLGDAVTAARAVVDNGPGMVLASLGGDGAILCSSDETIHGRAESSDVVNTVGAGDTLLAGFLAGSSTTGTLDGGLSEALTWARAAVRSPLTTMRPPGREDRRAVSIAEEIDPSLPLADQ